MLGIRDPGFWSEMLKEKGLESPGREEAVRQALEYAAKKKQAEDDERKEKQTQKKNTKKI